MKYQYGCHVSVSGGWDTSFARASDLGATSLQIFTKSPRTRALPSYTVKQIDIAQKARTSHGIIGGMIHASYLINLAKPYNEAKRERDAVLFDMRIAHELGFEMVNVHVGKTTKKYTYEQACVNMYDNTAAILDVMQQEGLRPVFVYENTAGQGTEMGYRFEELGELLHTTFANLPIYVCLDTCHLWAAGYDLSQRQDVIDVFDTHVGIDRLRAIHLNDAKVPCGSFRDRHANHGRGFIGYTALAQIVQWAFSQNILTIQETPDDALWSTEVERVFSIVDGEVDWIPEFDATYRYTDILEKYAGNVPSNFDV